MDSMVTNTVGLYSSLCVTTVGRHMQVIVPAKGTVFVPEQPIHDAILVEGVYTCVVG